MAIKVGILIKHSSFATALAKELSGSAIINYSVLADFSEAAKPFDALILVGHNVDFDYKSKITKILLTTPVFYIGSLENVVRLSLQKIKTLPIKNLEQINMLEVKQAAEIIANFAICNSHSIENFNLNKEKGFVVIGASVGGTEATQKIIMALPANFPAVMIVQHMPFGFTQLYANRLNNECPMQVKEAEDNSPLLHGQALIAPAGVQARIIKAARGYVVKLGESEKVSGHVPSVDVMFESVAKAAGANCIGVILTGMGSDGAKGLLSMRQAGAHTIGQDKSTCVVYGMPQVAYNIGAVAVQAPLNEIAELLKKAVQNLN